MKHVSKTSLAQTRRLAHAVLDAPAKTVASFASILKALSGGKHRVVIEVPWYADGDTHLLILDRIVGDRIHFYNTAASLERRQHFLERRTEADGTESTRLDDLRRLFESADHEALILPLR
jgi:hypothetical protein